MFLFNLRNWVWGLGSASTWVLWLSSRPLGASRGTTYVNRRTHARVLPTHEETGVREQLSTSCELSKTEHSPVERRGYWGRHGRGRCTSQSRGSACRDTNSQTIVTVSAKVLWTSCPLEGPQKDCSCMQAAKLNFS